MVLYQIYEILNNISAITNNNFVLSLKNNRFKKNEQENIGLVIKDENSISDSKSIMF